MDASQFIAPEWGKPCTAGGSVPYTAFVPARIPKRLDLSSDTVMLLSEADAALGRLAGAGRVLPDPHLLANAYTVREAVSSSRIEGTQASVTDVFDADATGENRRNDVREVRNYVKSIQHGISRLDGGFPLCLRLLREMHAVLLQGVRGQERTPGEFRRSQNWIESPDNQPRTARYVPPPLEFMNDALDDWEKYLHDEEPHLPLLIRCALLHYQFETIHPFLDGNGRLGRLFIVLYLKEKGRLPAPLLYLSTYFDQYRSAYYDHLQYVREKGHIVEWLHFFLQGIVLQATDSVDRAELLSDLREQYRRELWGRRGRAHEVIDLMFENPILTVRRVQNALHVSQPGAANILRVLSEHGILRQVGEGAGVRRRWFCDGVLDALDPSRSEGPR